MKLPMTPALKIMAIMTTRRTRVARTASKPISRPGVTTLSTICCMKIEPTAEATAAVMMHTTVRMMRTG